jgi:hypothetical protein
MAALQCLVLTRRRLLPPRDHTRPDIGLITRSQVRLVRVMAPSQGAEISEYI